MKSKKLWKRVLYYGSPIIAIIVIQMIIKIGMEGMWLLGIPKFEDVTSVTIKYPSLTEENLEITDSEQIELCVNLSGFLKYKPFVDGDAKDRPLITFYYHLKNGDQVEVSANNIAVFYQGKRHILKDDNSFVKFVEVLFYQEYFAE